MEFCLIVFFIICTFASCLANPMKSNSVDVISDYITNGELETFLDDMQNKYPEKSKRLSIGKSVNDNDLWAMEITGNITNTDDKPKFRYVGNIHGNEFLGRYLLVRLIQYLLENYEIDDDVTKLLDSTDIFIMPSMNPDGFALALENQEGCETEVGRENGNDVDLMKDFPKVEDLGFAPFRKPLESLPPSVQPETRAMMDWMRKTNSVLSASLNSGAIGATYREGKMSGNTQDVQLLERLEDVFFSQNTDNTDRIPCDPIAGHGISNGDEWNQHPGKMEDYVYLTDKSLEIAFYMDCCDYPPKEDLQGHWNKNRPSLLNYIEQVHIGVSGRVLDDKDGSPIAGAKINVKDSSTKMTDQNGYFWKLLVPGNYELSVKADRYKEDVRPVEVKANEYADMITIQLETDDDTP